jgi:hypothetical protein
MLGQVRSLFEARAKRDAAKEAVRAAAEPTFTREEYDAAYAKSYAEGFALGKAEAYPRGLEEGRARRTEGFEQDAKAEQERLAAIFRSDAAKGRPEQTWNLAFDSDLTAEQAILLLGKSPIEASVAATPPLLISEMGALSHPNIGRDGPAGGGNGGLTKFQEGALAARSALGMPPEMPKY